MLRSPVKLFPNPLIIWSHREATFLLNNKQATKSWYAKNVLWSDTRRSASSFLLHLKSYHIWGSICKNRCWNSFGSRNRLPVNLFVSTYTTANDSIRGRVKKRSRMSVFKFMCLNMKQSLDLDCECLSIRAVRHASFL